MISPWAKREDLLIPLPNIIAATNNFHENNLIGEGGFGKVYRGKLPEAEATVAIKRLDPDNQYAKSQFFNELSMLFSCYHPNIITLIGYCDQGTEMIVVSEFAVHGSLDKHLTGPDPLSWVQRLKICIGAARGLEYLHSRVADHQQIIHRDIKCGNILLDDNLQPKIIDFGMSKLGIRDQQHTVIAGTDGYYDPVYYETSQLTIESDVYSFGVVLLEILTGKLAFEEWSIGHGEPHRSIEFVKIFDGRLDEIIDSQIRDEINPNSLEAFKEVVIPCISLRVKERPTMEKIIQELEKALTYQENEDIGVIAIQDKREPVFFEGSKLDRRELEAAGRTQVGEGWFGKSFKLSGVDLMIKDLDLEKLNAPIRQFEQHMEIVGNIKHENVVPLLGYYYSESSKLLFYDDNNLRSLDSLLSGENRTSLDWDIRLKIALGASRGIAHIHEQANGTLVHGNIRAPNIFVNTQDYGCVRDVGLWKLSRPWKITHYGGYEAPEVTHSNEMSQKSDVYSFGVLLFHLLTGRLPAQASGGIMIEQLVKRLNVADAKEWQTQFVDKELKNLYSIDELVPMFQIGIQCVERSPEERPKMAKIVKMIDDIQKERARLWANRESAGNSNRWKMRHITDAMRSFTFNRESFERVIMTRQANQRLSEDDTDHKTLENVSNKEQP